MYPSCSRYGSYTSSIVDDSSDKDAARVSSPTGPPPKLLMIVFKYVISFGLNHFDLSLIYLTLNYKYQ